MLKLKRNLIKKRSFIKKIPLEIGDTKYMSQFVVFYSSCKSMIKSLFNKHYKHIQLSFFLLVLCPTLIKLLILENFTHNLSIDNARLVAQNQTLLDEIAQLKNHIETVKINELSVDVTSVATEPEEESFSKRYKTLLIIGTIVFLGVFLYNLSYMHFKEPPSAPSSYLKEYSLPTGSILTLPVVVYKNSLVTSYTTFAPELGLDWVVEILNNKDLGSILLKKPTNGELISASRYIASLIRHTPIEGLDLFDLRSITVVDPSLIEPSLIPNPLKERIPSVIRHILRSNSLLRPFF